MFCDRIRRDFGACVSVSSLSRSVHVLVGVTNRRGGVVPGVGGGESMFLDVAGAVADVHHEVRGLGEREAEQVALAEVVVVCEGAPPGVQNGFASRSHLPCVSTWPLQRYQVALPECVRVVLEEMCGDALVQQKPTQWASTWQLLVCQK